MNNIDPVILQLQADIKDYERNVTRAQRLADDKLDRIERKGAQMGEKLRAGFSMASAAAAAFAVSVVVDKVLQAVTAGLDYASSLGEVAQQLGVTTDALQEYRYAATQAGLSQDEMDQGLAQLTRRIGEAASGTKSQAEAFAKLGISVRDTNGNILKAGDAIPLIADALQRIESPAERAAILMDLFGKSGQKLEPLLAGGAKGVNNLRDAAHNLGIVLSEEQIQKADDTADKLASIKTVLEARIAGVVADNADAILRLVDMFAKLVENVVRAIDALNRFSNTPVGKMLSKGQTTFNFAFNPISQAGYAIDFINGASAPAPKAKGGAAAPSGPRPSLIVPKPTLTPRPRAPGAIFMKANFGAGGGLFSEFGDGAGVTGGAAAIGADAETAARMAPTAAKAVRALEVFTGELEALAIDLALAEADLSGNIKDRAAAEKRRIDLDLARDKERIQAEEDMTAADKAKAVALAEQTASARRQLVDQRVAEDIAAKEADIKREKLDLESAALSEEARAATSSKERYSIERRLLDIQQEEERARLELLTATWSAADAAQARADLERKQAAERRSLAQGQMGPGMRYLEGLRREAEDLEEAYQGIAVDGLQNIEDSLAGTVKNALGLHGVLGDIIGDFIQLAIRMAIIKPLAESIFGGGGFFGLFGGGTKAGASSIGSGIASLFGRASGGYVAPGQMVRVNEGASPGRVEAFMSRDGGKIIPLGQMNALQAAGGTGGVATVRVELAGDIDGRIQAISGNVAVEVVRASAPSIIDASARETMARAGRPRM